jgi:hypothetical protein
MSHLSPGPENGGEAWILGLFRKRPAAEQKESGPPMLRRAACRQGFT